MLIAGWLALAAGSCCPAASQRPPAHARGPRLTPPPSQAGDVEQVFEGRASYYHRSLAGNATANGEIYNPRELTAAHRKLPFGTRVRVTRLDNGRSVVVRINDRGPFGRRRRVLDLSRRAAEKLRMIRAGVVNIRAEVLSVPGRRDG